MIIKSGSNVLNYALGAICVLTPLIVGMISAACAGDQMKTFGEMNQPPLSPPAWLFPVVWSVLYILMGISLLLILSYDHSHNTAAVLLFILQLTLNAFWSPVFFGEKNYSKALIILLAMLAATIVLTIITWQINRLASIMLMPYIAWMSFATYLNIGIKVLN